MRPAPASALREHARIQTRLNSCIFAKREAREEAEGRTGWLVEEW